MKMFYVFIILIFTSSCIKTTEEIKREQKVSSLDQQMHQQQKTIADLMGQLKSLEQQINVYHGEIEELNHQNDVDKSSRTKSTQKQITVLEEQLKNLSNQEKLNEEKIASLTEIIQSQKEIIDELIKKETKSSKSEDKKKENQNNDSMKEAEKLAKEKKYEEAKKAYDEIIDEKETSPKNKNRAIFQSGVMSYKLKKFEDALAQFSNSFTQYPKSSIAPTVLWYIGKTLKSLNKTTEAKEAFEELMNSFPNSKEALDAKKEI